MRTSTHDVFTRATRKPAVVVLPPARYLAIEGRGAPEGPDFQAAVGALYGTAYTLKFAAKKAGHDHKVSPLEALWWTPGPRGDFDLARTPRSAWRWKAMIRVPSTIRPRDVSVAIAQLAARRGDRTATKVELETIDEGRVVQVLHVGPYATEPETVAKMRALMAAEQLAPRGFHHEIYLGDPRRAKPEKLRTILRQAVRPS
jgi:hypothetical protein